MLAKYDPEVLRFLMLSNHYASPLEVNKELLVTAERHLCNFYNSIADYKKLVGDDYKVDLTNSEILKVFHEGMQNDFNISLFLSELFGVFATINKSKGDAKKQKAKELLSVLDAIYPVLGLFNKADGEFATSIKNKYVAQLGLDEGEILAQISARAAAKAEKNWAVADEIRNGLKANGVVLMDTATGTDWSIDFDFLKN